VPNLDEPERAEELQDSIESYAMLFGEFFQSPSQIHNSKYWLILIKEDGSIPGC
jgi:hypothetical protein